MNAPLALGLRDQIYSSSEDRSLLFDVLGRAIEPEELSDFIEESVHERLSRRAARLSFSRLSVGAVFGIELEDGGGVVLKAYPRTFRADDLRLFFAIQGDLSARGFPAPRVLSELFRFSSSHLVFIEHLSGSIEDARRPDVRKELARGLAELATLLEGVRIAEDRGSPLYPGIKSLWPKALNSKFRLLEASAGSEWIDRRARAALQVLRDRGSSLEKHAAHSDWGAKNIRFANGKIAAVFDWDSIAAMSEAEMVGRAAAQFTAQWDFPSRVSPTMEEAQAFAEEYLLAKGRRFSGDEWAVASASGEYLVAHVARQEQSSGIADRDDGFAELLRECAGRSLLRS